MRKPLIERKRRERINNCLDQLKETVIGAFGLDVSIHHTCFTSTRKQSEPASHHNSSQQQSKLEKADILEMTVKHLQNIQSTNRSGKDPETWLLSFHFISLQSWTMQQMIPLKLKIPVKHVFLGKKKNACKHIRHDLSC